MKFLRELLKISEQQNPQFYVPTPSAIVRDKLSGKKTKKRKHFPSTTSAEDTLINTLWTYNNSDAS